MQLIKLSIQTEINEKPSATVNNTPHDISSPQYTRRKYQNTRALVCIVHESKASSQTFIGIQLEGIEDERNIKSRETSRT